MALAWYPKYTALYARDTKHLSLLEHGAYGLLLDYYYSTGPIPAFSNAQAMLKQSESKSELLPDHSRIYRICTAMTKPEQDAVDNILRMFFFLDGGFYRNNKADEVTEIQTKKHENRVNGPKKAKEKRQALLKQCSSNAIQNQIKNQKENLKDQGNDFSKNKGDVDKEEISEDDFIRQSFQIQKVIKDSEIEKAKAHAPGWDMQGLYSQFNEAIRTGKLELPTYPGPAFIGWVKSVKKGKRPQ